MSLSKRLLSAGLSLVFMCSGTLAYPLMAVADDTEPTAPSYYDTVKRVAGSDRYETAAKISWEGWPNHSECAVLAAGMDSNLADALTSAPLAKKYNAPILLTEGTQLNEYAKAELERLQVKKIYVTSGKGVITQNIHDQLVAMGIEPVLLGGKDRFETSVNIANEVISGAAPKALVVTTAWSNADALSIASIAAAKGIPVLLTDRNQLPDDIMNFISSVKGKIKQTYVLGGEGVISQGVFRELPNPTRIAGSDRYETNIAILKTFADELDYSKAPFLANGEDAHLVDSLAGSPLAALTASPIILSGQTLTPNAKSFLKKNYPGATIVLGGDNIVTPDILKQIRSSSTYADEGAVIGPAEMNSRDTLNDNVIIAASDFTLRNIDAKYSIVIQGENVTLQNVNIEGTLYLASGDNNRLTLAGVNAQALVIGKDTQLDIKNNTTISRMTITADVEIEIDASSQINNLSTHGYDVALSGEGMKNVHFADGSGEQTGTGGLGGIGGGGVNLTGADSIIESMTLNLSNGDSIAFIIGKEKCTVNIKRPDISDEDVVLNATITVSRTAELNMEGTILTDPTSASLDEGATELSLSSLGIISGEDDGIKIGTLKQLLEFGSSISGVIVDQETSEEIPVTFQLLNK